MSTFTGRLSGGGGVIFATIRGTIAATPTGWQGSFAYPTNRSGEVVLGELYRLDIADGMTVIVRVFREHAGPTPDETVADFRSEGAPTA